MTQVCCPSCRLRAARSAVQLPCPDCGAPLQPASSAADVLGHRLIGEFDDLLALPVACAVALPVPGRDEDTL